MRSKNTVKKTGRPAVAVHFFNDFTLNMSTVVGLQASIKNTCWFCSLFYMMSDRVLGGDLSL